MVNSPFLLKLGSFMHVAIVGSGPSGLYCADYLAKQSDHFQIDIYEKHSEPFGLLRFGVAPDHIATKRLAIPLQKILDRPNIRFIGNTEIGRSITADQLYTHYDIIVLAAGSSTDRLLSLPKETHIPYYPAGLLAHWYNGFNSNFTPYLGKNIALFGQGNVAIDLARLLSKSADSLQESGLSNNVISALTEHQDQRKISIIGRGQTYDAKCTTDMLKELLELPNLTVTQQGGDLSGMLPSYIPEPDQRTRLRNIEMFQALPETPDQNAKIHIEFRFNEQLANLHPEHITLTKCPGASTNQLNAQLSVDTLLSAIGFIPTEIAGFGEANECAHAKVYSVGWYAHGPNGVIQANRVPSIATAKAIIAEAQHSFDSLKKGYHGINTL
jgi:ferredoxin--NADP+ reductase